MLVYFQNSINADEKAKKAILDGSYLAGVGNLIVVTANYRVGVFGFFSAGKLYLSLKIRLFFVFLMMEPAELFQLGLMEIELGKKYGNECCIGNCNEIIVCRKLEKQ